MPVAVLDGSQIHDFDSFHTVCAETLGFPNFYGRNMNAWIGCMTSLDSPDDGMTTIHATPDNPLILMINEAKAIPHDVFEAINECSAFVNWRRLQVGEPAILMLAYWR